jgi:hypothetical protein
MHIRAMQAGDAGLLRRPSWGRCARARSCTRSWSRPRPTVRIPARSCLASRPTCPSARSPSISATPKPVAGELEPWEREAVDGGDVGVFPQLVGAGPIGRGEPSEHCTRPRLLVARAQSRCCRTVILWISHHRSRTARCVHACVDTGPGTPPLTRSSRRPWRLRRGDRRAVARGSTMRKRSDRRA